jgi:hypothetical protein
VKIVFYLRRSLASLRSGVGGPVCFLAVCILRCECHFPPGLVSKGRLDTAASLRKAGSGAFLLLGRFLSMRLEMHGHPGFVHSTPAESARKFAFVLAARRALAKAGAALGIRRVEVVPKSHCESLADRSSKRNGPLVLALAGGNA